jgi:hypothetical protein
MRPQNIMEAARFEMDKYICRKCKDNMIKQCLLDFTDGYPPCSKLSEVLNPAPNKQIMPCCEATNFFKHHLDKLIKTCPICGKPV